MAGPILGPWGDIAVRATLGGGLLLVSTSLVGIVATPAEAATGCENPDTTWVGPATEGGSVSWDETANWTNGVPTAASVVCLPAAAPGPHVLEGTAAEAGAVTLEGALTVAGSLDVATLEGDLGELHGPGTTTVTERLSGTWLTLEDSAVVDLREQAALGGELHVYDGSKLNVRGDTALEPGARIDSFSETPGLFTITETGSLTFDSANESADVIGGFANHGDVNVTAGWVLMQGASPEDAHTDQFSTGSFTGAAEATFNVSNTELRDGDRLDHVTWVDHVTVPAGNTVTAADSGLVDFPDSNGPPPPSILGAGEIVVTDDSSLNYASIGGSLTVTVPVGEVFAVGHAAVAGHARLKVDGELAQWSDIDLDDDAVLDIYGTHRAEDGGGGVVNFSGTDPGLEVIHPGGQLVADPDGFLNLATPLVNEGTVDSRSGFIQLAPLAEAPSPSSGLFRGGPPGQLHLGDSFFEDAPPLALDQAVVEGEVDVDGSVVANGLQVRGQLVTQPGGDTYPPGQVELTGNTTLADGASIAGKVTVGGQLEADLGASGTATLSGAAVTGQVHVVSGTLSVPSLAPSTLEEDGTLTSGEWIASLGATLDLPAVTTIDASLLLMDPGSTFGDGLATLTGVGPNGTLLLGGGDLAVPGLFRNEGDLYLFSGSRLDVGGKFRQSATGILDTYLESAGRGQVRAAGVRDLAGKLVIERDPAYKPPVGTVLNLITSDGRRDVDDAFDKVVSPKYGTTRRLRVDYGVNRVRLRVDRVG